jgi:hypothetical protein
MKWSADQEDLSLLPYMTSTEKEALRRVGVTTIKSLATLKDFAPGSKADLTPAPGREAQVKQIAATWPVGPRLDELIHRAKSFRRSVRKDGTQALSYIPGKGNSSLPVATPDLNPNLVRIYIDAQQDYLEAGLSPRCPSGCLQGWHANQPAGRGAHYERPTGFCGEKAKTVRGLDP